MLLKCLTFKTVKILSKEEEKTFKGGASEIIIESDLTI